MQRGECHVETDALRKDDHMMTEAEIKVMLVQAKDCGSQQKLGERARPCGYLDFGFFYCFKPVYGSL